jgi:hypothetical protein
MALGGSGGTHAKAGADSASESEDTDSDASGCFEEPIPVDNQPFPSTIFASLAPMATVFEEEEEEGLEEEEEFKDSQNHSNRDLTDLKSEVSDLKYMDAVSDPHYTASSRPISADTASLYASLTPSPTQTRRSSYYSDVAEGMAEPVSDYVDEEEEETSTIRAVPMGASHSVSSVMTTLARQDEDSVGDREVTAPSLLPSHLESDVGASTTSQAVVPKTEEVSTAMSEPLPATSTSNNDSTTPKASETKESLSIPLFSFRRKKPQAEQKSSHAQAPAPNNVVPASPHPVSYEGDKGSAVPVPFAILPSAMENVQADKVNVNAGDAEDLKPTMQDATSTAVSAVTEAVPSIVVSSSPSGKATPVMGAQPSAMGGLASTSSVLGAIVTKAKKEQHQQQKISDRSRSNNTVSKSTLWEKIGNPGKPSTKAQPSKKEKNSKKTAPVVGGSGDEKKSGGGFAKFIAKLKGLFKRKSKEQHTEQKGENKFVVSAPHTLPVPTPTVDKVQDSELSEISVKPRDVGIVEAKPIQSTPTPTQTIEISHASANIETTRAVAPQINPASIYDHITCSLPTQVLEPVVGMEPGVVTDAQSLSKATPVATGGIANTSLDIQGSAGQVTHGVAEVVEKVEAMELVEGADVVPEVVEASIKAPEAVSVSPLALAAEKAVDVAQAPVSVAPVLNSVDAGVEESRAVDDIKTTVSAAVEEVEGISAPSVSMSVTPSASTPDAGVALNSSKIVDDDDDDSVPLALTTAGASANVTTKSTSKSKLLPLRFLRDRKSNQSSSTSTNNTATTAALRLSSEHSESKGAKSIALSVATIASPSATTKSPMSVSTPTSATTETKGLSAKLTSHEGIGLSSGNSSVFSFSGSKERPRKEKETFKDKQQEQLLPQNLFRVEHMVPDKPPVLPSFDFLQKRSVSAHPNLGYGGLQDSANDDATSTANAHAMNRSVLSSSTILPSGPTLASTTQTFLPPIVPATTSEGTSNAVPTPSFVSDSLAKLYHDICMSEKSLEEIAEENKLEPDNMINTLVEGSNDMDSRSIVESVLTAKSRTFYLPTHHYPDSFMESIYASGHSQVNSNWALEQQRAREVSSTTTGLYSRQPAVITLPWARHGLLGQTPAVMKMTEDGTYIPVKADEDVFKGLLEEDPSSDLEGDIKAALAFVGDN